MQCSHRCPGWMFSLHTFGWLSQTVRIVERFDFHRVDMNLFKIYHSKGARLKLVRNRLIQDISCLNFNCNKCKKSSDCKCLHVCWTGMCPMLFSQFAISGVCYNKSKMCLILISGNKTLKTTQTPHMFKSFYMTYNLVSNLAMMAQICHSSLTTDLQVLNILPKSVK